MSIVGVIPARMKSNRFPNKVLHPFFNKPILGHIIDNCLKIGFLDKIVVLTEDELIEKYVRENYKSIDVEYYHNCRCGTERLYQYYLKNKEYSWYFYFPADEPTINFNEINNIWAKIPKRKNEIISFYTQFFCQQDLESHLSCKIVTNVHDYMIYNSRAVIPITKEGNQLSFGNYKKHVGVFIFPREILEKDCRTLWGNWKSPLQEMTGLEQNRFIDHGLRVKMARIKHIGFGIDTIEQIKILETRIASRGKQSGYSNTVMQLLSEDFD